MFGIGFSELVLIGLILIIFVKPEDLPKFFRTLGKLYGQLKKAYDDVVSVKDKILKEIDDAATLEEKPAAPVAAGASTTTAAAVSTSAAAAKPVPAPLLEPPAEKAEPEAPHDRKTQDETPETKT
ncbi:MAG: hypothetical protein LBI85_07150 [Spirochaetaceae bacterium]|jgi:sec-independent protein translocase protein TatB|nr:hypothetical protein [Spirochaetaceae bacterium]